MTIRLANKYKNRPTEFRGQFYDSKAEAARAAELYLFERAGAIEDLRR